ncbi:MAG: peroxidase [Candidatus Marinimicrobia bacterium]|nr:peroxidase [Candidatus Neomarinimicrobiota bacterium]MCH8299131.1 peroxidase [Candidatus Neomarinimicrobiota bacterium]TFB10845.1 peroxidase [Candidatus Marinimicrobia bacterium MT.SAG.2]
MDNIVEELQKTELPDFLTEREKAIVQYSLKITKTPSKMTKVDVDTLKKVGITDEAILNIVMVNGYFAFVNRMADGLGVELEEYWSKK